MYRYAYTLGARYQTMQSIHPSTALHQSNSSRICVCACALMCVRTHVCTCVMQREAGARIGWVRVAGAKAATSPVSNMFPNMSEFRPHMRILHEYMIRMHIPIHAICTHAHMQVLQVELNCGSLHCCKCIIVCCFACTCVNAHVCASVLVRVSVCLRVYFVKCCVMYVCLRV